VTVQQAPLAGMRVLDFTRILSGPYATMLLADLGADVIKIERPGSGDDTRGWGPPFTGGMSTYFAAVNRGKRSVALDLQSERGQEIAAALAADADVLIENFRPGVCERLGLGYERLRATNPGLVYASINGFGSHGPRAQDAGTEVIVEAQTGLMAMMGTPDGPPVRFGVAMVDIATGIALVCGVLAALLERERDGGGRLLEFPLYSTAFSCLATVIASASIDAPSQEGRWGSGHPSIVPYAAYEASDGFVVLGAINELMWERLCGSLGLTDLTNDERARSNEHRVANRSFVDGEVAAAVAARTSAEITEELNRAGVLVAPVLNAAAAVDDPQVAALGLVDELDGIRYTRTPLSQFASAPLAAARPLGADTEAVLAECLSLGPGELEALDAAGVISSPASHNGAPPSAVARW
jgi:crotonobetainyl-CoA:carnitine CoA-transferase CaiB-like acyl-CoA transferase